jgi:hypothetical protein
MYGCCGIKNLGHWDYNEDSSAVIFFLVLDKILKISPINKNKKKSSKKKNAKMSDGSEKTTKSLETVPSFFFFRKIV